jgi:hypothetical protein
MPHLNSRSSAKSHRSLPPFATRITTELYKAAMENIWALANVRELEFATVSRLLAKKSKTMSLPPSEQPDDNSSDEDELEDDGATSRPTSNLATCDYDALMDKFLARLAEVFSREKSASHVAATALIKADMGNSMIVLVAKNEGLDDRDMEMVFRLQQWLRAIAITGQLQSIQTDSLWVGDGGLIEYSRQRLWYHISRVQKDRKLASLAALPSAVSSHITRLQCLCQDAKVDSSAQQFGGIVEAAYILRSLWKGRRSGSEVMKGVRDINMLGRLRAAYECFKSVALTFDQVKQLEMKPVVRRQDAQSKVTIPYRSMQMLCAENDLMSLLPERPEYVAAASLHVHAEMQILVNLAQTPDWYGRAHRYIGVSKKLCFLCEQILQNCKSFAEEGAQSPTFRARECHGKVYPLWTLPQCVDLPSNSKRSLAKSITSAHQQMRQLLQEELHLRPAVAESSVGVTNVGSSASAALLRDRHLTDGQPLASPKVSSEVEQPSGLGREIKTAKVGRLPADGSDTDLVPVAFHALSKTTDIRMFEFGKDYVPDFHEAWDTRQFDRRYRNLIFKDQACECWNGEYRLYWNENPTLPINETIKAFLKIEGEVERMRRFWYGDVFLVRFSEQPKTFDFDVHDLPFTIAECRRVLEQLFRDMWEEEYLEAQLEEDRYMEEDLAKTEADKEVILQRMSVALVPFITTLYG